MAQHVFGENSGSDDMEITIRFHTFYSSKHAKRGTTTDLSFLCEFFFCIKKCISEWQMSLVGIYQFKAKICSDVLPL